MEIPERLSKESELLTRMYNASSKSMKKRIEYDFDYLKDIAETLDTKIYVPNYDLKIDDSIFMRQVEYYIDDLEYLAEIIINLFKYIDFYYYERLSYIDFSKKDLEDLLSEFLEYFSKDLFNIYKELLSDGRIDFSVLNQASGESFFLNHIDSYYMIFNPKVKSKLFLLETIIHELCHIYSNRFLKNYRYNATKNIQEGFFGETVSLYSEMSLYEFLKRKNINNDGLNFNRNCVDYLILHYFKTINYIAKVSVRDDIELFTDNVIYRAVGNNSLDIEEAGSIYEYTDRFYNGYLQDFRYAVSTIDAFSLLQREESGEDVGRMINSYLISFQNDRMMDEFLEREHDVGYMFSKIKDRNMESRKKYPIIKE